MCLWPCVLFSALFNTMPIWPAWTIRSESKCLEIGRYSTRAECEAAIRCSRSNLLPSGCHGNLTVLNLLSASVAKDQHFRPCRKNYALGRVRVERERRSRSFVYNGNVVPVVFFFCILQLLTVILSSLIFISLVGPPLKQFNPLPYVKKWLAHGHGVPMTIS